MISYEKLTVGKEYKIKFAYYKEKVNTKNGMYYRRGREYSFANCILINKKLYDDKSMKLEVQINETNFREFILPVKYSRATGVIDIVEI